MRTVCFEHRKAHGLIYEYNMPFPHADRSGYVRTLARMYATPFVSYQDILDEVASKQDDDFLKTVTVVSHFLIISLTVGGFKKVARITPQRPDEPLMNYEQLLVRTAQSLIAERDYEFAGGYNRKDHKFRDYWPKD